MSKELIFHVVCKCGFRCVVEEAEAAQCHAGTASEKAARHNAICPAKGGKGAQVKPVFRPAKVVVTA